jgi:ferritin heavy chain
MSLAKQNFSTTSEEGINQQINTELQASQVYLSMAAWAQHSSIALPGKLLSCAGRKPKIRTQAG